MRGLNHVRYKNGLVPPVPVLLTMFGFVITPSLHTGTRDNFSLPPLLYQLRMEQCRGSGSGIRCFLTPGSGIEIRDYFFPDPGSF
jgi:hypothetical protein